MPTTHDGVISVYNKQFLFVHFWFTWYLCFIYINLYAKGSLSPLTL